MNRKLVLNFVFFIISLECWIHSSEYTQAALSCIHFRVFSTPVQLFKIQSSALFLRFITYKYYTHALHIFYGCKYQLFCQSLYYTRFLLLNPIEMKVCQIRTADLEIKHTWINCLFVVQWFPTASSLLFWVQESLSEIIWKQ